MDCYEFMEANPYEAPDILSQKVDHILSIVQRMDQRLKSQSQLPCVPMKKGEHPRSPESQDFSPTSEVFVPPNGFRSDRTSPLLKAAYREKPPIFNPRLPSPKLAPPIVPRSTASSISPPVPPKPASIIEPQISKDGSMTFTASQCLCLTLQLKAVKMFIDDNFDDQFVDKEINMAVLNATIRTLSGNKNTS